MLGELSITSRSTNYSGAKQTKGDNIRPWDQAFYSNSDFNGYATDPETKHFSNNDFNGYATDEANMSVFSFLCYFSFTQIKEKRYKPEKKWFAGSDKSTRFANSMSGYTDEKSI